MASISLLHATHRSSEDPTSIRDTWLRSASNSALIEYIFAMDTDDHASVRATEGLLRCLPGPSGDFSTAVRNWNAAASIATNDILFVIADDLRPPLGWDSQIVELFGDLDPLTHAFTIKICDSPEQHDTLMRHPVISRAFFGQHGLFDQGFSGVYCDNDITLRAYWKSMILDGRSIGFEHIHPAFSHSLTVSESQARMNRAEEYMKGEVVLTSLWPKWKIRAGARPIRAAHPLRRYPLFLRMRAYLWAIMSIISITLPVKRKVLLLRDRLVQSRTYRRFRRVEVVRDSSHV